MAEKDIAPSFLKRKCAAIFRQLTSIQRQITSSTLQSMDQMELSLRIELLDLTRDNFEAAQSRLEEEDPDELDSTAREDFLSTYIAVKTAVARELKIHRTEPCAHSSTANFSPHESQSVVVVKQTKSRLPELQLPSFGGAYTEWPNFFSMFHTVVHNEPDLSKLEKFQHLRTCLKDSALDTIQSLEICDSNYDKALELLKTRFDNKRLIFQAHIRELFRLKGADGNAVASLRQLIDKFISHTRALQSLGTKEQIADCLLIHIISQKLDTSTQTMWEEKAACNLIPTWDSISSFLEKRCQTLENVIYATVNKTPSTQVSKPMYHKKSFVVSKTIPKACAFCKNNDHLIYTCPLFANLSPNFRWKESKRAGLCLNCLKHGHHSQQCKSSHCRRCTSSHHTLLHFDSAQQPSNSSASNENSTLSAAPAAPVTSLVSMATSTTTAENPNTLENDCVLLATAVVLVKNSAGTSIPCRAILDSASQLNFITTRLSNQLNLKMSKLPVSISGIGDSGLKVSHCVNIDIQSMHNDFTTTITSAVIPTITDFQPSHSFRTSDWGIPPNIKLADSLFYQSQRVDVLLGAGIFFDLLCIGQIRLKEIPHILQKTRLGWVVSGGQHITSKSSTFATTTTPLESDDPKHSLNEIVRSFWEIESSFDPVAKATKEELDCEEHFKVNCHRLATGEFSVRLPMKHSADLLGDSYEQAFKRFLALERRLQRNSEVKAQYSAFIREYAELRHMSLLKERTSNAKHFYLPHHCVIKTDSTTTKLRVVFDGSAVTSSGYSLNEILMAGPTIQPKLVETLIRFRSYRIAVTGDICKMYRCVRVSSPDDLLQCILWRDDPHSEIQVYKLETVTYGTKPASFLAIRAMQQLAVDESKSYPLGSQIVFRDFYVDDMITGADTVDGAIDIMLQTSNLLAKGKFKIRKWCSSHADVLSQVPPEDKEKLLKFDDGSNITKALGLLWNPEIDTFFFSFVPEQRPSKFTKRTILSTVARFYDPLGLIGPIICKAKIFIQLLWKEKLNWDESLSMSLHNSWQQLYDELDVVKQLKFPRFVSMPNASTEVHAFCDASLSAYGECVYIRSRQGEQFQTALLCSKSRVSPLKILTVPKLELCAAALLAQVVHTIASLNIFDCPFYCWSDSSIVLSWLKEEPSRFNIFVANRVCSIQQLTKGMEWRHVPTSSNPADILSRGASPNELLNSHIWKYGPTFLLLPLDEWPKPCAHVKVLPETRKTILLSSPKFIDTSINSKYIKDFKTMQHIYGYVYKFIKKDRSGTLTSSHIQYGTFYLLRMIQRIHFCTEYAALEKKMPIKSSSTLFSLSPFLDEFGLLRVGGRLKNAVLDFQSRHPVLLPKRHPITISIITHLHNKYLHAGPQSLLASVRLQYWPIGGRKTVTYIVNKCIRCFRAKPRLLEHIMADLPSERVQASRTFLTTGIDYCGPFYYNGEVRNRPPTKCYVCLFVCFGTKAVHLELVKDLSTASFLAALQRFVCLRGKPKTIWSDNATNFVGAKNELADLRHLFISSEHQHAVHKQCLDDGIDWKFIPPRSPHFGGLWESAIKSAKCHFYRVVGSSILTYDELRTLICHISAIVNSRPLIPLTEHKDDLEVLTPAHFLIGAPFTAILEPNVTDLNVNRLGRWQRISTMQQIFWKKWSTEYLTQLQQRSKWRASTAPLCIDSIVLIKDENLPPLRWPLAKVIDIVSGSDGVARVALLQTRSGITKRAIAKLCLLPLDDCLESMSLQRLEDVERSS